MTDAPVLPTSDGVRWSARVVDAAGELVWEHDPATVLRTASVGKVLLLLEVDRLLQEGSLAPDRLVAKPPVVRDSGLWHTMRSESLPVDDLAVLVGAVSDNLATNALLHVVGLESVDALRRALGLVDTRLLDEVRPARGPGHPPTLSTGRADELCTLMCHVAGAPSPRVRGWLAGNTDLSMVAGAFDLDPLAHRASDRPPLELVSKTGTDDGVRADVGHVRRGEAAYAYAVVANWEPAAGDRTGEVLAAMRGVGDHLRALVV